MISTGEIDRRKQQRHETHIIVIRHYGLSVKWATCNLGASAPEEYGDYCTWRDIETYYEDGHAQENPQPHRIAVKKGYTDANYRFCVKDTVATGDGTVI